ncbi:MAG: hypothetical protein ABIP75_02590 [Pyrinomonadaceae bacterium]
MRFGSNAKLTAAIGLVVLVVCLGTRPVHARFDGSTFAGTYTREFIGASGKVTETLEVKADKSVVWTSNYSGRASVVQSGIWNARGDTLIVVLDKRDGEKMPADERVVFDRKGKDLKGRVYDHNVHGNSGLVFHRSL